MTGKIAIVIKYLQKDLQHLATNFRTLTHLASAVFLLGQSLSATATVVSLPHAHSHNDYFRSKPLSEALSKGFCSVEADTHLRGDKLFVAHWFWQVDRRRTLSNMYIKPLFQLVQKNGGEVYPGGCEFSLMIDVKNKGAYSSVLIEKALKPYAKYLSRIEKGVYVPGAVKVILSGERPVQMLTNRVNRLVFVDGRIKDLAKPYAPNLVPLISDKWSKYFNWDGNGKMPSYEKARLDDLVYSVHKKGMKIRFWGTPEKEKLWEELIDSNVDLINTDKLGKLGSFLRNKIFKNFIPLLPIQITNP